MAKISYVLLFFTIIATIRAQCTTYKANSFYKRSVYEFSLNLLKRLSEAQDGHFVASPFSAWSLISSLAFAADGDTQHEIRQVLRLHHHKCFTDKYYETIIGVFQSDTYETTLEKSSALFIDENVSVKPSFIDKLINIGIPDIVKKPFDNFEEVANSINDYVSKGTGGLVTDIISPEDISNAFLILIDALYFKAPWQVQFSEADTEISAFYDDSGENQIGDVNLMYATDHFNVTYVRPIKSRVLELPYGFHSRFSMLIFLPDQGVTLSNLIDSMSFITLRSIFVLYGTHGVEQVTVQIPRFKISSDMDNLKELLSDMGLKDMFDPETAQFPRISDYSLYISNLVQKATIEINEQGSEASAASAAVFEAKALPQPFFANKPFLFMIVDKHTEIPLFVGSYSKPTVF